MSFDFPCPKCSTTIHWTGKPMICQRCRTPFRTLRAAYLKHFTAREKSRLYKEAAKEAKARYNFDFPPIRIPRVINDWLDNEIDFLKSERDGIRGRKAKNKYRLTTVMKKQEIIAEAVRDWLRKNGHTKEPL